MGHLNLVDRNSERRLARIRPALVSKVRKGNFVVAGFVHFRLDNFCYFVRKFNYQI
jgi:hypothetical protein